MQLYLKCLVTGALALKVSGGGPHLKPHLKPSAHLASLGVVISPLYRVFSDLAVKSPLRLRRASPAVLPSLCPAWHTPACQGTQSATPCHPMPPLQPSSAFSLRGSSQVGTSQLSRNIANTPYSATSTPKQARIFCLCVCGNSQYRCNRAPERLFCARKCDT